MTLPHDEAGQGPALILMHAGIADRRMWSDHMQPLAAAGLRVVAIDLPGFGDAPVAQGEDAPWKDVLATLDALGIERATLVGNSFGGAVALRVAAVAPERVEAIVLISAPVPGVEPSEQLQAAWTAEEDALDSEDLDGAVEAVLEHWLPADAPPALRSRIAEMQRAALELQLGTEEPPEAEDPLEQGVEPLRASPIRALLIVGEGDKPDFHLGAELLAKTLPDARREVLADVAHLAPLEAPEPFRELLLEFVGAGTEAS